MGKFFGIRYAIVWGIVAVLGFLELAVSFVLSGFGGGPMFGPKGDFIFTVVFTIIGNIIILWVLSWLDFGFRDDDDAECFRDLRQKK